MEKESPVANDVLRYSNQLENGIILVQDLTLEGKYHHRSPGMEVQRDFLIIKEAFPFCLYDHEISARTTAPDEEVRRLGCRADHHSSLMSHQVL